jgi:hypothetical protein
LSPGGFRVGKDNRGEFSQLIAGRPGWQRFGGNRRVGYFFYSIEHANEGDGIDAGKIANGKYQHEAAQSQASSDPGRSHAPAIFDIIAFPLSFPAHTLTLASGKETELMEPHPSVQCKSPARISHDGTSKPRNHYCSRSVHE